MHIKKIIALKLLLSTFYACAQTGDWWSKLPFDDIELGKPLTSAQQKFPEIKIEANFGGCLQDGGCAHAEWRKYSDVFISIKLDKNNLVLEKILTFRTPNDKEGEVKATALYDSIRSRYAAQFSSSIDISNQALRNSEMTCSRTIEKIKYGQRIDPFRDNVYIFSEDRFATMATHDHYLWKASMGQVSPRPCPGLPSEIDIEARKAIKPQWTIQLIASKNQ